MNFTLKGKETKAFKWETLKIKKNKISIKAHKILCILHFLQFTEACNLNEPNLTQPKLNGLLP